MNFKFIYHKKGMAIVIALVLAVVFTMFTVLVMNLKNAAYRSTKKLNRNLRAYYLALSVSQHALLKIKELRQYFYDALDFSYHIDNTGNLVIHTSGNFTHPVTQSQVSVPGGVNPADALKYMDVFKCDIFSYTYYANESSNSSDWEFGNPAGSGSNAIGSTNLTNDPFSNSALQFGNAGWVSIADWGDPFNGEYHLSNLMDDQTDILNRQYAPTGGSTNGIAQIINASGLNNNTVPDLSGSWIRSGITSPISDKYLAEEGLIRFSTEIIDTGVQNDSSDDTEIDSIQLICIGIERPLDPNLSGPKGSRGEPNLLSGGVSQGIQVVRLKKIEKIERRIEN